MPVVISALVGCCGFKKERACWRAVASGEERRGRGEVPVVEVRILVFDRLTWIPRDGPQAWSSFRNQGRSEKERQMDVSSMMEVVWATAPSRSSIGWSCWRRSVARVWSSMFKASVRDARTRQASNGLSG